MTTVGDKYFSENCLGELDRLDDDGLVITRDGVPYAKLVRICTTEKAQRSTAFSRLHGILKGKIVIKGDIMSTGVRWNAVDGE